jgi:hypothetical protein
MSDEDNRNENENRDLTSFEASLAALRPRTDGLDPQWRSLLAKEASSTAEGGGAGVRECVNPAGHRFLCIHCGSDMPSAGGVRRWAWPASLAAMTSVAAMLLIMVVARPESPMSLASSSVVEERAVRASLEEGRASEFGLAMANVSQLSPVSGTDNGPYMTLRNQVLAHGAESWKLPVSAVDGATSEVESPLTYREQLQRLLEQQGLSGS